MTLCTRYVRHDHGRHHAYLDHTPPPLIPSSAVCGRYLTAVAALLVLLYTTRRWYCRRQRRGQQYVRTCLRRLQPSFDMMAYYRSTKNAFVQSVRSTDYVYTADASDSSSSGIPSATRKGCCVPCVMRAPCMRDAISVPIWIQKKKIF